MASVNKWFGIGNLTKDVEIRYSADGKACANFSIACNETWKDKDGNKQESVEFVNISMFGRQAEVCGQYLSKGDPVYIEGKIQTRKWEDNDGNTRYSTGILANQMQMLKPRSE